MNISIKDLRSVVRAKASTYAEPFTLDRLRSDVLKEHKVCTHLSPHRVKRFISGVAVADGKGVWVPYADKRQGEIPRVYAELHEKGKISGSARRLLSTRPLK